MAIAATAVWEIQTGGNDTNGGGFVATGTDYSLVTTKRTATGSNDSTTDAVANASTTLTSATAAFTSALIGNIIYLQGGTGALAATRRQVISVTNATTIVLDATVATGTGITMNIGGCLASLGESGRNKIGGNIIWIKAGTYTITSSTQNVSGGRWSFSDNIHMEGYQTTRGDRGTKPVITTSTTNFVMIDIPAGNGSRSLIRNLAFDGASAATVRAISTIGGVDSCTFTNFASTSCLSGAGNALLVNCSATANTSTNVFIVVAGDRIIGCLAYGNTTTGSVFSMGVGSTAINCIAYNNTVGATFAAIQSNEGTLVLNCVSVNNSSYGFKNNAAANGDVRYFGCIAQGNGNNGFNIVATSNNIQLLNCAGWNNTGGDVSSLGTGVFNSNTGFVTGTATFFVDVATLDFRLNSNSSGTACKGTGFPGVSAVGTGYADIGALQSLAGAGGGGSYVF